MPMMFVAAMMVAQTAAQPAPIVVNKKKDQVCELVDVSGSRMRQKVCHDRGSPATDPNSETAASNAGMFHAPPPAAAPGGVGAPPR